MTLHKIEEILKKLINENNEACFYLFEIHLYESADKFINELKIHIEAKEKHINYCEINSMSQSNIYQQITKEKKEMEAILEEIEREEARRNRKMEKWEKAEVEVFYQKNEWIALYINSNGDRCYQLFDTIGEASEFFSNRNICKIGIVTTDFYNCMIAE